MARTNNSLKFLAAAVAVVGVAFCAGYFLIGGIRTTTTPETVVAQSTTKANPAPSKPAIASATPRTKNSDYNAPGAPRIQIVEEKNPSLIDTSKLQAQPDSPTSKTPDSEASQEAAPPPPVRNSDPAPDLSADPAPSTDPSATPPPAGTTDTTATSPDPDTEQPGTPPADPSATPSADVNKPQYRVQTGSFVTADNAQVLADALHRRGYATSTRIEHSGSKTVYTVQIGAYHTRSAADKAAQDLQSSGYPADVSPVGP